MKSNHPLISVIIPCYNVKEYVLQAVESILCQTYRYLEIWLIDDASDDGTREVLMGIKDDRIKLHLCNANTKKIGAVNEVLKMIEGDYVMFQDADDYSLPDRIEQQLAAFEQDKDLAICFTAYNFVNAPVNVLPPPLTDNDLKNEFCYFGSHDKERFSSTVCATMMITKKALLSTGGYHPYFTGRVGEDIYWVYTILKNQKGFCIRQPLYFYRRRVNSLTGMQLTGKNIKASYSWPLLQRIIHKDFKDNIDVLDSKYAYLLKEMELEACEEVLAVNLSQKKTLIDSTSYKLGRRIISVLNVFKINSP